MINVVNQLLHTPKCKIMNMCLKVRSLNVTWWHALLDLLDKSGKGRLFTEFVFMSSMPVVRNELLFFWICCLAVVYYGIWSLWSVAVATPYVVNKQSPLMHYVVLNGGVVRRRLPCHEYGPGSHRVCPPPPTHTLKNPIRGHWHFVELSAPCILIFYSFSSSCYFYFQLV